MEQENITICQEGINMNIVVREEEGDEGRVVVVNNEELGISDFGDNFDEALDNFKKSARLYLEVYPEKKELLKETVPLLVSRIML